MTGRASWISTGVNMKLRKAFGALLTGVGIPVATLVRVAAAEPELVPGPAIVRGDFVNVRGQPTLQAEVLTQVRRGDVLQVLEVVKPARRGTNEPAAWAKVQLPTNCTVWVHAKYVDPETKTVKASRLNMRAGPGENYSVLGVLERGTPVVEVLTKGEWMQIEAPTNAVAFVAARYLEPVQVVSALMSAAQPQPKPEPQSAIGPMQESVLPQQPEPATNVVSEMVQVTPSVQETLAAPGQEPPAVVEPEVPPKRIVQREGVIRPSWSIQAPTMYSLVNPKTGETLNFLYLTTTNIDLKRYKGVRVVVTGEEGLHPRWPNIPVLTIQRIQVLD